ncbi:BREX system P-loop protein BrxC [Nostoc sp. 'Peltigera membranacea cyanobiont' 232]|uniref:BREX system P-loop protein BrxC n=1 Tax=Nostoc sp. 'Peltigera membranacea cyanobiont' 232 TaxID=2014531 RepID=UPI001CB89DA1|nr:BREX system P-loop protein BrxC [Nostoc sp. 'Peltigera membranacea cyanobiont' 232]
MATIQSLFSSTRPIDRQIEKVIDYSAQDEDRLATEISEYEITDNIERCYRRFLDVFSEGVRGGRVTETGIWVSGFYGSGKSSFTKYLGFALEGERKKVRGKPFLELLSERFVNRNTIQAELLTLVRQHSTVVIFLDLGSEQLSESAATPVSTVLYWKVLQWAGFSKEKKLAQLELTLERQGKYAEFQQLYRDTHNKEWEEIHNDPLLGVSRAAEIVTQVLPKEFPTSKNFRELRFDLADNLRDRTSEIINLVRQRTKCENILFLLDEAGQYVAPRGELILNLDGMARNFKELGEGKVWIIATGQQTLNEIVEKAAYNSAELNKLRDRFPISIHLDASDIREITYRRLLTKPADKEQLLKDLFATHGQAVLTHTRLTQTVLYKNDPNATTFAQLYPFLPQHFDLLLELIRTLARSTGGVGLRSAIRVIQDVLIDKSRVLPANTPKLAERPIGVLACVDDFYNTLREDIGKVYPHVVSGADKVVRIFSDDAIAHRVAKAVAALQPIDTFPRTAENIAALLYPELGSPSLLDDVQQALKRILNEKECGLIEDPQAGGYVFLSESVRPLRDKRTSHIPTSNECFRIKEEIVKQIFQDQPSTRLDNVKEVKAIVKLEHKSVVGRDETIDFKLEFVDAGVFSNRRTELMAETNSRRELKNSIVWLAKSDNTVDELLQEIARSEWVVREIDERADDKGDVAQFLRAERRSGDRNRDEVAKKIERLLMEGTLIFRGKPTPVSEAGQTLNTGAQAVLADAAKEVFQLHHLAAIRPSTDIAAKFLSVERLDRITEQLDPLRLVTKKGSNTRVNVNHPALAEVLRVFRAKLDESGSGRLQGNFLQDFFSADPYGWTKDTVRYLFAALLTSGEIELHYPKADGPLRTPGPLAVEAMKNTMEFSRVGVSLRDSKPSIEALERAAQRLEQLFAVEIVPLEDYISRAVQKQMPEVLEQIAELPVRLRLLDLLGEQKAKELQASLTDILRGDASNATALLGSQNCTIPDDIQWAKQIVNLLNNGAETEFKAARSLLHNLDEFKALFPKQVLELSSQGNREAIYNVFHSERFQENLPELRRAVRELTGQLEEHYTTEVTEYKHDLQKALNRLELEPEWVKLADEQRTHIADRLQMDFPEQIDGQNPVRSLQVILTRRLGLTGLVEDLRRQIQQSVPHEAESTNGLAGSYSVGNVGETKRVNTTTGEYSAETAIDTAEFVMPVDIENSEQLDTWLASIREKLLEILNLRKHIRIKG